MERHIQTFLMAVLLGVAGWIGVSSYQTGIVVAKLEERSLFMAGQIASLSAKADAAVRNQYTAQDANRDLGRIDARLSDHDRRLRRLEDAAGRP